MRDQPPIGFRSEENRDVVISAYARTLERLKKVADAGSPSARFTIECDEGERMGGDGSAPSPLTYFTAAFAF